MVRFYYAQRLRPKLIDFSIDILLENITFISYKIKSYAVKNYYQVPALATESSHNRTF